MTIQMTPVSLFKYSGKWVIILALDTRRIRSKSRRIFSRLKRCDLHSLTRPERTMWNTLLTYVTLPLTPVPFRKGHLNMLRFPFNEIPSYVCESTCVSGSVRARVGAPRRPVLEPFQLLMHYRQIGPQIGLFAVDWHHTEMTSPLKWRGPRLTLWPLLKKQLQYNSFMSWIWLQPFEWRRSTAFTIREMNVTYILLGASLTLLINTTFFMPGLVFSYVWTQCLRCCCPYCYIYNMLCTIISTSTTWVDCLI